MAADVAKFPDDGPMARDFRRRTGEGQGGKMVMNRGDFVAAFF